MLRTEIERRDRNRKEKSQGIKRKRDSKEENQFAFSFIFVGSVTLQMLVYYLLLHCVVLTLPRGALK